MRSGPYNSRAERAREQADHEPAGPSLRHGDETGDHAARGQRHQEHELQARATVTLLVTSAIVMARA